jgi:hypothetical protein
MGSIQQTHPATGYSTRILVAGVSFIGAALVFLAGSLTPSVDYGTPSVALATIANAPDAFLYTFALDMLYAILLVPALLGVAGLPRGRGAALTYVGAGLALFGNLGHTFIGAIDLVARNMAVPAADRGQMLALLNRLSDDAAAIIVLPMMLAFVVGSVLTAAGLWRARLIPVWPVTLMLAAGALDFLGLGTPGEIGKLIVGAIASIWIGVALIRLANSGRAVAAESGALATQPQGG